MDESIPIGEKVLKLMNIKRKHLIPVIEACQKTGNLTGKLEAEQLAFTIIGTFRLLMFRWRVARFEFNLIEEGNIMIASLLTLFRSK